MDATFGKILVIRYFVLYFLIVMYIYSIRLEDESNIKYFNGKVDQKQRRKAKTKFKQSRAVKQNQHVSACSHSPS